MARSGLVSRERIAAMFLDLAGGTSSNRQAESTIDVFFFLATRASPSHLLRTSFGVLSQQALAQFVGCGPETTCRSRRPARPLDSPAARHDTRCAAGEVPARQMGSVVMPTNA